MSYYASYLLLSLLSTLLFTPLHTHAQTIHCYDSDLVSFWQLDEGSGLIMSDTLGTCDFYEAGEDSGDYVTWLSPSGIQFTERNGMIEAYTPEKLIESLVSADAFTLEVWLLFDTNSQEQGDPSRIFSIGSSSANADQRLTVGWDRDDQFVYWLRTSSTPGTSFADVATVYDRFENPTPGGDDIPITTVYGSPVHIVATWDGQSGTRRLYVNGNRALKDPNTNSAAEAVGGNLDWSTSTAVRVANQHRRSGRTYRFDFLATYYKMAVWHRELTATEVIRTFEVGRLASATCVTLDEISAIPDVFSTTASTDVSYLGFAYLKFQFPWAYTQATLVVRQLNGAGTDLALYYAVDRVPSLRIHDGVGTYDAATGTYRSPTFNYDASKVFAFAIYGNTNSFPTYQFEAYIEVPAPEITTLTFSSSSTDFPSDLTLAGSNFAPSSTVTLDGAGLTVVSSVDDQIVVNVPPGQGAELPVVVTSPVAHDQASTPEFYSYDAPSNIEIGGPLPTVGGELTIIGRNLGIDEGVVTIDGKTCTVTGQDHLELTCTVPEGVGSDLDVVVTIAGQQQENANLVFAYEVPAVFSVTPSEGGSQGGTVITIVGENFGPDITTSPDSAVTIGGAACTPVFEKNHTHIICATPVGSGTNFVIVRVAGQDVSDTVQFEYAGPVISNITSVDGFPTGGNVIITIHGSGFGSYSPSTEVLAGAADCVIPSAAFYDSDRIRCTLPGSEVNSVQVRVTVGGQPSDAVWIAYDPPTVSDVVPRNGPTAGSVPIVITGYSFGIAGTEVSIGGQPCLYDEVDFSDGQITCSLPAGVGTNNSVVVTTNGRASTPYQRFDYDGPSIDEATPNPGPVDGATTLVITGDNFGSFAFGTVLVGSEPCRPLSSQDYTNDEIQCSLPAGTGKGLSIVVTVDGQESDPLPYAYAAPEITRVRPVNGPTQGASLTIEGLHFGTASDGIVTVNGRVCEVESVYFNSRIECEAPAGTGANAEIAVIVDGQNDTSTVFSYDKPNLQQLSAVFSTSQLVTTLSISGTSMGNLSSGTSVRIGAEQRDCPVISTSHSSIQCALQPWIGRFVQVQVVVDSQVSNTLSTLSFPAPVILNVTGCDFVPGETTPDAVENCQAGNTLVINGHYFGKDGDGAVAVFINNTACTSSGRLRAYNRVFCVLPNLVGNSLAVTVEVGGQSTSRPLVSYRGPVVSPNTIRSTLGATKGPSSLFVATTLSPATMAFSGRFFGSTPSVFYGPPTSPRKYECTPTSSNDNDIECSLETGSLGANLVVQVFDGDTSQYSPLSSDTLSFPPPEIWPNSLGSPGGSKSDKYGSSAQIGEAIEFKTRFVGTDASQLQITYGPVGEPDLYSCNDISISAVVGEVATSENRTVQCTTQPGDGRNLVFRVQAANQFSELGTDTYSYPFAPTVISVSGCTADESNENRTIDCPTAGGTIITITGFDWATDILSETNAVSVRVGVKPCVQLTNLVPGEKISCRLPTGTGLNVPIVIGSAGLFSRDFLLIDYAAPSLTSISGCESGASVASTVDCPRDGQGTRLELQGSNFGDADAVVLVGGRNCEDLTHASGAAAHTTVTCSLPSGSGDERAVILVQDGLLSTNVLTLSYEPCPAGQYPESEGTRCFNCSAGSFSGSAGQPDCTQCEAGFFAPNNGSTGCELCPRGTYSERVNGVGPSACIECLVGTFADSKGSKECVSCGLGTFNQKNASSTCQRCEAGTFASAPGSTICLNCTAGRFQLASASAGCTVCPVGTFSETDNAVFCTTCDKGEFAGQAESTKCEECAAGRYQPAIGQGVCEPCGPGRFAQGTGNEECTSCVAGRYQPQPGASGCIDCPKGRYGTAAGQAVCLECPVGTYCPQAHATSPTLCPAGTFADAAEQTVCSNCTAGSFSPTPGTVTCSVCPVGRFSALEGAIKCTVCPRGKVQREAGADKCDNCAVGTFMQLQGQASCSNCPAGSRNNKTGSSSCELCAVGHSTKGLNGQENCSPCTRGKAVALPGQPRCSDCPVGYVSAEAGAARCTPCDIGKFQEESGRSRCFNCTAGSFAGGKATITCVVCAVGRFSPNDGASSCTPCEAGSVQPVSGEVGCTQCRAGRFAASSGQARCLPCPAGKFALGEGNSECTDCDKGEYQPEDEQEACLECAIGSAVNSFGEFLCSECESGFFANDTGLLECTRCQVGRFSVRSGGQGAAACSECEPGTFINAKGQARCLNCPVATFGNSSGLSTCDLCPRGRFASRSRSTECEQCSPGRFAANEGLPSCTPCAPGTAAATNGSVECTPCDRGFAQPLSESRECVACPRGTFQSGSGETGCTQCRVGEARNVTAAVECFKCKAGHFQPAKGEVACLQCPPGRHQPATGQTSCPECDPGRFSNVSAATECLPCAPGQFRLEAGKTICESCVAGTFAATAAQEECVECDPGRFAKGMGSVRCVNCAPGLFQPAARAARCSVCPRGTEPSLDRDECVTCGNDRVAPLPGTAECTTCPQDSTNDDLHQNCLCRRGFFGQRTPRNSSVITECVSCPEGAKCDSVGVDFRSLETEDGWWRSSNESLTFYRCLIKSHCASGRAVASAGSPCLGNRDGPICAVCREGYHATSVTAECTKCPSAKQAWVSTGIVSGVIVLALIFMYWIVLRSDRALMVQSRKMAEHRKANAWAWFDEEDDPSEHRGQSVYAKDAEGGRGEERPNFTYKMKIILGFFQISTNLALALDAPWPTAYQKFISAFSLVNFDFISWSSVTCTVETDFFTQFWALTLTPLVIFVLVFFLYLVPQYVMYARVEQDFDMLRAAREREVRQFWKLFLFTLFLIYPGVSSTVMRVYVCRKIDDTNYLLADFSIVCGSAVWRRHAYIAIGFVLVYPIGIPLFFWWMVRRNLGKLHLPAVRVQIGFLYEAYSMDLWWFELPDMANKLFLTSIVAFFPPEWQLRIAMVWAVGYLIILLWASPYLRAGDDRLHLFAQMEIFLMILVAYTFVEGEEFNETSDATMAGVMILANLFVLILFAWLCGKVVRILWRERQAREAEMAKEAAYNPDNDDRVEDEAEAETITELRLPKNALMVRNPLFSSSASLNEGAASSSRSNLLLAEDLVHQPDIEMSSMSKAKTPKSSSMLNLLRDADEDEDGSDDDVEVSVSVERSSAVSVAKASSVTPGQHAGAQKGLGLAPTDLYKQHRGGAKAVQAVGADENESDSDFAALNSDDDDADDGPGGEAVGGTGSYVEEDANEVLGRRRAKRQETNSTKPAGPRGLAGMLSSTLAASEGGDDASQPKGSTLGPVSRRPRFSVMAEAHAGEGEGDEGGEGEGADEVEVEPPKNTTAVKQQVASPVGRPMLAADLDEDNGEDEEDEASTIRTFKARRPRRRRD